jgi:hypothetical protein
VQSDYETALDHLMEMAVRDVRDERGAGFLVTVFAFIAARAGAPGLSVALLNLGDNELAMEDLARFGDSLHDL